MQDPIVVTLDQLHRPWWRRLDLDSQAEPTALPAGLLEQAQRHQDEHRRMVAALDSRLSGWLDQYLHFDPPLACSPETVPVPPTLQQLAPALREPLFQELLSQRPSVQIPALRWPPPEIPVLHPPQLTIPEPLLEPVWLGIDWAAPELTPPEPPLPDVRKQYRERLRWHLRMQQPEPTDYWLELRPGWWQRLQAWRLAVWSRVARLRASTPAPGSAPAGD